MKCPYCIKGDSKVVDTRQTGEGIRRRRECLACGRRFTTYERVAPVNLLVVKRDGRREEFDREKLRAGLRKACAKRPISAETLEQMVTEIEGELYGLDKAEVESRIIGEKVMARLRVLDDVAYVRFSSVYRHFADVESLAEEIERLLETKSVSENSGSKSSGVRNLLRDGLDKVVISRSERPRTSSGLLLHHSGDFLDTL